MVESQVEGMAEVEVGVAEAGVAGVMEIGVARVTGAGVAGMAEAGMAEAGVTEVMEVGVVVVAEAGVAGEELMGSACEVLGEILEGVAVEEMVAEAWDWLDKRSLAGFGLATGCRCLTKLVSLI